MRRRRPLLAALCAVDLVHLGALALSALGALAVWAATGQGAWIMGFNLVLVAGLLGLVAGPLAKCGAAQAATIRMLVSVVLVSILFSEMSVVVPNVNPLRYDAELLQIDRQLLGFDPNGSLDFLRNRGLTDLFAVGYFSFYFIPLAFFAVLYRARSFDLIACANLAIVIGFYLSFVGNTIFPAVSPFRVMEVGAELSGLWFYEPLHRLVDKLEPHKFSAFPSGHILVAAIVTGLTALWRRDVLAYFLAWTVLLWLGTIYLRYHYLIDTLISLPLALLCIWVAGPGWRCGKQTAR
jgi:hypothetical protein